MRYRILKFLFVTGVMLSAVTFAFAHPRTVEKVDPPNWWAGMTVNPVRVLVRGNNLGGAVTTNSPQLRVSSPKPSANGHYLFFDLAIAKNAKPGKYKITIGDAHASTNFDFEILPRASRVGRYQGYTTDDVIYFLMPDRFADGDPSNNDPAKSKGLYDRSKTRRYHGGDLQGVIDQLPYLKSLGVTALWTTPVYDNNDKLDYKEFYDNEPTTGYHGYGAVDMYAVDEHFGDVAKLRELNDKARALGIKTIQDQVANHTGPFHVWANDPPTPTWWNGTVEKHTSNNWQKWTAMNPRATYQTQSRNIDGWFIDILPDFNQGDPEVEKYLIQNSIWWIETAGFDAIRMDTLPHVPRKFWQSWAGAIKREYPNVNILGELFDADPALLAYFQAGRRGHDGIDPKIDTLFDFPVYYAIRNAFGQGKNVREVSQAFAHDWLYPNPGVLTTFLGNHDVSRFMGEEGATIDGLKLAQTLLMTSRGTPILYYGDEIAIRGGGDPDNRRDFPGGFSGDRRNAFTAAGRSQEQNEVWNHLAKLGALRRDNGALRRGKTFDLLDEEQQMAYGRVYANTAVIVVINNDKKPATVRFDVSMIKPILPNETLVDALGKTKDVKLSGSEFSTTVPARTAGVFRRRS